MDFRILGPLEVEVGGRTAPIGGPKQRALLGLLLIQANRVVSLDRISYGLWSDSPPARAAATIQVYVSQLRKQLERDRSRASSFKVLVSQAPGYVVRVGPDELDAYRFQQLNDAAISALAVGEPEIAATLFRQALAMWRGPALADFAAEPWAIGEASRLNEMRLHALEQRVEADLALGRHAELIGELEALIAEHPLRERLRAQLMLALYRSGRQAEASDVFHRIRDTLVEELGMEPGPELQGLLKQILLQDPELDMPAPPKHTPLAPAGRLPAPLTRFIGRETELEEVCSQLMLSRLVSVLGIGGVGKTRLAIEASRRLAPTYRDGIRYIDLASLSTADLLPEAVIGALGLRDQSSEDVVLLIVNHLAFKHLLLVFDNCEHVAAATARLVDTLLMLCPEVRVLATTRETLGIHGECVYRLQGLPLESDSVDLFIDRAHGITSALDPTTGHIESIRGICERLDGIPLAIELATALLNAMPPHEILRRLDRRLDLLTVGARNAAQRQRTLAATFEWSYRLLTEKEQRLFRRVSVCRGWFDVAAAEDIGAGNGEIDGASYDTLVRLVDKSMLVPGIAEKLGRCRMLETVRDFATAWLERTGEAEATAQRHAHHYLEIVERAATHLRAPDQRRWLDSLGEEYDNIRVALGWSLAADPLRGLKAVASLSNFWFDGRQTEGRYWISRLLDVTPHERGHARAEALYVASWLGWMQADYDAALGTAQDLIALSVETGDQFNRGRGRRYLALLAYSQEDADVAAHHFAEAIPDLRSAGTSWELAIALNDYSLLLQDLGQTARSREALAEALALAQESTDPRLVGIVTETAATFALLDGNVADAHRLWKECLRISDDVGDPWAATYVVDGLARLALQEGRAERSLCLVAASSAIRESMGSRPVKPHQKIVDEIVGASRNVLDPRAADAAWERGRRFTWAEVVDYALEA